MSMPLRAISGRADLAGEGSRLLIAATAASARFAARRLVGAGGGGCAGAFVLGVQGTNAAFRVPLWCAATGSRIGFESWLERDLMRPGQTG